MCRMPYQVTGNFNFPRFQGGPTYVFQEGLSNFFQGGVVELLIDRICDLYWTPIPPLDPRNYGSSGILPCQVLFF